MSLIYKGLGGLTEFIIVLYVVLAFIGKAFKAEKRCDCIIWIDNMVG